MENIVIKQSVSILDEHQKNLDKYKRIAHENYVMNRVWNQFPDYNKASEIYNYLVKELDMKSDYTDIDRREYKKIESR